MTLQEVSVYLGLSTKTISNNLKRTQNNLQKKGITLKKYGCGNRARYEVIEGKKDDFNGN